MEDCTVKGIRGLVDGSFFDDRLAIIDNVTAFSPTKASYKICMFAIVFVRTGKIEMTVNSIDYVLGENDIFVFSPNFILDRFNASMLTDVSGLCIAIDYATTSSSNYANRADVLLNLSVNPHIQATHAVIENLTGYVDILRRKFMEKPTPLNERIINSLVDAAFNEMVGAMSHEADEMVGGYSSADAIFRNFLKLLDSTTPRGRRVDEYAHKLNITPKYLSAICRRKSGMTAIQVINKAVLSDALKILHDDTKSIHDVAEELGFPNQSFFGTFLKKHTGLSPLQFRNRNLKKEGRKRRKKDDE